MDSLKAFASKFKNKAGIPFIKGWRRIDKEPYEGVCQDFAWTALVLLEGSVLKALVSVMNPFRVCFFLVLSSTNKASTKKFLGIIPMKYIPRHIALWHKDHGWIDSSHREWRPTATPHTTILPIIFPWVWFRVLWGAVYPFK